MEGFLIGLGFLVVMAIGYAQGRAEANGRRRRAEQQRSPFAMGSMIGLESGMPGIGINKRHDD